MDSVFQKLSTGFYDVRMAKPSPPPRPILVLRAGGEDLNAEDHRHHAQALDAWEARMAEYRRSISVYELQKERLIAQFWKDLEAESGMTGHPKAAMLREMVILYTEPGNAHGLIVCYSNLVKLVR